MNIYTHEISKILNISIEDALKVQNEMECSGFDFSEASDRAFKREANAAQYMLGMVK